MRGLWLMPVTTSLDHDHGYWTSDFRNIEPAYGSLADMDELISQARKRGIGIVIDYVINHAAADHPHFVDALKGPASRYRDGFVWSEEPPPGWDIWGKYPWYHAAARPWEFRGEASDFPAAPAGAKGFYFGTFGPQTPDLNFRNPELVAYQFDSLRFWLDRGLAGFRLDAVPHLVENNAKDWNDQPESRALTRRMQELIKSYPNRYVVCEATASPQAYGDPAVCGGAFAFGYVQHFAGAARGQVESVQALASYYRTALPTMATFVSNHDLFAGRRLWDQVEGDIARYKLAAAGYLLQPGTPFIYFGEEVGQAGSLLPADNQLRAPMSWTADESNAGFTTGTPFRPLAPNARRYNAAAQARDPNSILAFYKVMLKLRNTRPSIQRGSFEHAFAEGLVLGFRRKLGDEESLALVNYGTAAATATVRELPARARLLPLYPRWLARPVAERGEARVLLPPQSVAVFELEPS